MGALLPPLGCLSSLWRKGLAMKQTSISIALAGSGGAGIITTGSVLLDAAARAGLFGLMSRSVGAQIRGGETVALLRIGVRPIETHADVFDVLIALDWQNLGKFAGEIPLDGHSLIVGNADAGEMPAEFKAYQAREAPILFQALSKDVAGARPNMIALGIAATLLGLPRGAVRGALTRSLEGAREKHLSASIAAAELGAEFAKTLPKMALAPIEGVPTPARRWSFTGNEAAGLGALKGGVRFVAAYPITPATELLESVAPLIAEVGGALVQVEDELACINQLIGASFGGVASLTATSGPGLSLMMESLGLAVASETPIVVVDVMRGGPSTGIPAKTEQSDLNIAIYGQHGDAPHLVLAANSIMDCMFTTQWTVHLVEALQTAAIVLSDQFLGQSRMITDRLPAHVFGGQREMAYAAEGGYNRYALTASGVSPMAIPGTPGCQYTADGLEHAQSGAPSSQALDHAAQLDKRLHKLAQFDFGDAWADVEGDGETVVLTWGSCTGAAREAIQALAADGVPTKLVSMRLLSPLQVDRLEKALAGAKRVLVVELNHSGQFYRYLRSFVDLACGGRKVRRLNRAGPLPIKPSEIREQVLSWT